MNDDLDTIFVIWSCPFNDIHLIEVNEEHLYV